MPPSKFENAISTLREKHEIERTGEPEIVTTGSLMLDFALRKGGIPRGCIVDLFGEESLGKTTLTISIMSERVKNKEHCAYIDVEHRINHDLVNLLIPDEFKEYWHEFQPKDGDSALALLESFVKMNEFRMIAVDSMAAIVPCEMLEEDANPNRPGLAASRITQALKRIMGPVYGNEQIVILINQMRDNMSFFAKPGGKKSTTINALKFFSSIRMQISNEGLVREGDESSGQKVMLSIVKNSFAKPHGKAPMTIMFGHGIDKTRDLVDCGIMTGVVMKNGGWLSYKGANDQGEPMEVKAHGEDELMEKLAPAMNKIGQDIHLAMKLLTQLKGEDKNDEAGDTEPKE